MDEERKNTRKKLKEATLPQYESWTTEAALTPSQKKILDMHILTGLSIIQISCRVHASERTVTDRLVMAYKKVSSVIRK